PPVIAFRKVVVHAACAARALGRRYRYRSFDEITVSRGQNAIVIDGRDIDSDGLLCGGAGKRNEQKGWHKPHQSTFLCPLQSFGEFLRSRGDSSFDRGAATSCTQAGGLPLQVPRTLSRASIGAARGSRTQ